MRAAGPGFFGPPLGVPSGVLAARAATFSLAIEACAGRGRWRWFSGIDAHLLG
jgi:hypothetical protein